MSKENVVTAFAELHSEEVQEVIGQPPHWIVRWGITLFFGLVLIMLAICWIIRYPDIVTATFTLTSKNPPRAIVIRSEGKLEKLLVQEGSIVQVGDLLSLSESTANAFQVLELEKQLVNWNKFIDNGQWEEVTKISLGRFTNLGELQNDFQAFTLKLAELRSVLSGGFYPQKRSYLLKDMEDLHQLEKNLIEQSDLQDRDYNMAKEEFATQELLFKQKVIARIEYKRENAKLLSKEFPLKMIAASIIQNRSLQTTKRKEILELDNVILEQKNSFMQTLHTLQSGVSAWKQKYVLTSPIAGKVSFSAPWNEQQYLTAGQELMTIAPTSEELEGIIKIYHANLGKIEVGQQVLIKLDGYPFREYGMISGQLFKISQTPSYDSLYWGYVALPNQLKTGYNQKLLYRNGMKGTAEIVTTNRRIAERLVATIRNGGK